MSTMRTVFHLHQVPFKIEVDEPSFPASRFNFYGTLYQGQKSAVKEMGDRRFGILVGPAGSGKKVVSLFLTAKRELPALIIVKTKSRLLEWCDVIHRFSDLMPEEIGLIGNGHHRIGERITIAIDRSLYKHIDDIREKIGFVIVDRCEQANLKIFFDGVGGLNPKYILGLARNYARPDGLGGAMISFLARSCPQWKLRHPECV